MNFNPARERTRPPSPQHALVKGYSVTVVVQNWYFIRAGLEGQALEVRRDASRVRQDAGRHVGRILVPAATSPDALTFIWECDYADEAAREVDAAWADASPEFTAVRERMGTLLERFERIAFVVDAGTTDTDRSPNASGV